MRLPQCLALAAGLLAAALPAWAGSDKADYDYHGDQVRSGNFVVPTLTRASAATVHRATSFSGIVPGNMYAQPLYWVPPGATNGYVVVATDQNIVEALDATTGLKVWQTSPLGPPGQARTSNCPTKKPVGITGTPVIDPVAGTIYVDADIQVGTSSRHVIYGLSLTNGSVRPGWPIDVGTALAGKGMTFLSDYQGQRGALALINGSLYVTYASNRGDCGSYHGWVVGLNVATPAVFGAWSSRGLSAGIWSQGGVTTDGVSMFVTTGNGHRTNTWADQEAVFRISPTLQHSTDTHDFFYTSNWIALDNADLDLGGTGPVPVDVPAVGGGVSRWLIQFGKDGNAYVLDRDNLGGMGGALLVQPVANGEITTGPAAYPAATGMNVAIAANGLNCPVPTSSTALSVVNITSSPAPAITTVWCASMLSLGSPIVTTTDGSSNSIVWMTSTAGDHMLHGYAGDTGTPLFTGGNVKFHALQHFSTLLPAQGRLYVASQNLVFAFDYTPGL